MAEGVCRDIVRRYLPACELVISRALLAKLAGTMREKFRLDADELPFLKIYEDAATVVKTGPLTKPVCRDKDDDELLATSLVGQVEVILTGDQDLLVLKEFQGIKILSPRQFVEMMDCNK